MVSKILITNTPENFIAGVAISRLQHQVFCVSGAATLQVLSLVDELQQSWCLMPPSFLLQLGEVMVAVRKKMTVFHGSAIVCWTNTGIIEKGEEQEFVKS